MRQQGELVPAFEGTSDEGHQVLMSVYWGEPRGLLAITLHGGQAWTVEIGIPEISLFLSKRTDLLEIYMEEMILNARAAVPVLH